MSKCYWPFFVVWPLAVWLAVGTVGRIGSPEAAPYGGEHHFAGREWRNPHIGKPIKIPAKKVAKFTPDPAKPRP